MAAPARDLTGAKLDIGCGSRKCAPDHVGIDRRDLDGVDIVGDALEVLGRVPDGAVERIHSAHFLEHVEDVEGLLAEMARVVRPGGDLELVVPHFSNPYGHSDLTHRHAFGLYSLAYLVPESPFKRGVPTYGALLPLRLRAVRLEFRSSPPFYGRHAIKRGIEVLVNLNRATQEFYEENLVYLVPCYQLRFRLVKVPAGA